jgi:hypothetical protein
MDEILNNRFMKHVIRIFTYMDGRFWIPLSRHMRMDGIAKNIFTNIRMPKCRIIFGLFSLNNPLKKNFIAKKKIENSNMEEKMTTKKRFPMDIELLSLSQYIPKNMEIKP